MKSSKKAVKRRNNSERSQNRPQNRHLRPWKKGDPNIPKSPGRPRSVWHEFARYVMEHPDSVDDYFRHPVFGKKRLHHLFNAMIERSPISAFRLFVSCEENGSEPEQQDQQGVNPPIECRSPEENLALELARARAQPGERVDSADDLGHELARVLAQDNAGFRKIENLRVSAPTMAWLLKLRQEHQERDAAQSTTGKAA